MRRHWIIAVVFIAVMISQNIYSHCQIPCGIYDDTVRFNLMLEDATTVRKSITEINKASAAESINYNQLVRWVNNKENHADNISNTVHYYFLAQRIKPDQDQYQEKLVALHKIIVLAMKNKQNADLALVDDLEKAINDFKAMYLPKDHKH